MAKALKIRDLTLRDGQQSLFGARMAQRHLDKVLPLYADAGFYIVEVWGGSVPDAMMKYLDENPWDRLRQCAASLGGRSMLGALSRGRNLFGFVPYPDYVVEDYYRGAVGNGLNVMRVFDALNDLDNIKRSVEILGRLARDVDAPVIADAALCFSIDPEDPPAEPVKKKGFFSRLFSGSPQPPAPPVKIFTDSYFVEKAKELENIGAGIVTLKDMAGLMSPARVFGLMPKLKQTLSVPVDFHTHCAPGYGLASTVTAICKGADIVDTCIWWFAGGTSAPPLELVWIFCHRLGIDVDIDMDKVALIRKRLKAIREEIQPFALHKESIPHDFDEYYAKMPPEIDVEFDRAIEALAENREDDLLEACHRIEAYFGLPRPKATLRKSHIPIRLYSHLTAQLHKLEAAHLLKDAIDLVPKVRRDAGRVPLVTPVTKIVADQALALAIDRLKGNPDYTTKVPQFISLVKGEYGKTPISVDQAFRQYVTGSPHESPYDVSSYKEPENTLSEGTGSQPLALDDEEMLLLHLHPGIAAAFLKRRRRLK